MSSGSDGLGQQNSKHKEGNTAFLCAVGFWRLCIPEDSRTVGPLYLVTLRKSDSRRDPEQHQAFEQIKDCSSSSPWATQDRTGCKKPALLLGRVVLPGVSGKRYLERLEDSPGGSGAGNTKDLRTVTPQLKKRPWKLVEGFGLLQE